MVFERGQIAVDDVRFGRQTELRDRVLFMDEKALSDILLSRDDRIDTGIVSIARPGDSTWLQSPGQSSRRRKEPYSGKCCRGYLWQNCRLPKEGFGNPDADQMLLTRGLEQAGIKVVTITDEFAGPAGSSQSLADTAEEADAVVSVGNANERVLLPPMEQLLGPVSDLSKLAGAWPHSLHEDDSLDVELQAIIGATNELGMQRLSCREA